MKKNKISIMVMGASSAHLKQVNFSRFSLLLFGFFIISFIAATGYISYEYYLLRQRLNFSDNLKLTIVDQLSEISEQRKHIQVMAQKLNSIKSTILEANRFENKIRIIANIEKNTENGFFGIGGAIPEDLDINVSLQEKHGTLLREMYGNVEDLKMASHRQKDGYINLLKYLNDKKNLMASTPAICPTKGWVTSRFGYRKSPFTGLRELHKGIDISNRKGTSVIAPANGIVSYTGTKRLQGKMIVIDHGYGMVTRYLHLSKILKKNGEAVNRGDLIGRIGNTGRSTGPHLHYDVKLNGVSVSPETYILN